jgi:deoxyribonuclease-4
MWKMSPKSPEDGRALQSALATSATVRSVVVHASYLINLGSSDEELLGKSRELLLKTVLSASNLGASYVVLHTGSHRQAGYEAVRSQIATSFLEVAELLRSEGSSCTLLIENTAGAGGTIGASLEELDDLVHLVDAPSYFGLCLDTQHLFAYGYDYRKQEIREQVVLELAERFGSVECVHLNDSKTLMGEKHDRHENLGEGEIGEEALAELLSAPVFQRTQVILEVPGDGDGPRPCDVAQARTLLGAELSS